MLTLASTAIITLLSIGLAYSITLKYLERRQTPLLFWALGLWAFAASAALEIVFAADIYSQYFMAAYLFLVVLVVQLLSIGSINLIKSKPMKIAYYAFSILIAMYALFTIITSSISNLVTNFVVTGIPPMPVIISSSIATVVASLVLIGVAAKSYADRHNRKMLYIIAGVVVVAISGLLYIVAFPVLLYYAEFIGIILLWLGFS